MPIYRKGDNQFALHERAKAEPQGFKYPDTVRTVLDDPETRIEEINKKPRVVPRQDGYSIKDTDPITGDDAEWSSSNSYLTKEFPVSGLDIAKLKRGR